MRSITSIIIHCSATPQGMDIGAAEIRQWHKAKGWKDIGYHHVIRRNGLVEPGRPEDTPGAHAEGYNSDTLGICLVGGTDADDKSKAEANFTAAQYDTLVELVAGLRQRYGVPAAKVLGHRDLPGVTKACPCFDVRAFFEGTN